MKIKHLLVALLSSGMLLASCGGESADSAKDNTQDAQEKLYKITGVAGEGYTFSYLKDEAAEGDTVSFRVTPTGDQVIASVAWNGNVITPTSGTNPVYRFTMPAEDVIITVTLAVVESISVDYSAAKTAFLVNAPFSSAGLIVKASLSGSSEQIEVKTFTVSDPDMTTPGTKTITVTYGDKTATYDIKVGSFAASSVALKQQGDKVYLSIGGTYEGFASAAELSSAAKGDAGIDIQSNNSYGGQGWDRYHDSDELTYAEGDAAGTFLLDTEISDLKAGGGEGYGYSIHFGLILAEGSEAGNPENLNLNNFSKTPLVVGTTSYSLWYNASWGVTSLMIADSHTTFVTITSQKLELVDDIPTLVVEGDYGYLDEQFDDYFYIDIMEFDTWKRPATKAYKATTTPGADPSLGTFRTELPLIGEDENHNAVAVLDDGGQYFFHFGHHASGDGTNITAISGLEEHFITDSRGDKYTLFANPAVDWKANLLTLSFSGSNYLTKQNETLIKDGESVYLRVSGIVNGFDASSEKFRIDVQSLGDWVYPEDVYSEVSVGLGEFTVDLDLTGKLDVGRTYFFHFGETTGNNEEGEPNYPNLYASEGTQAIDVTVTAGTYRLYVASNYADGDAWRNGLVVVEFIAAE